MIESTCIANKENRFWIINLNIDLRKTFQIAKGTIYLHCKINNADFRVKALSKGNGQYFIQTNKELQKKLDIENIQGKVIPIKIELDMVASGMSVLDETITIRNDFLDVLLSRRSIRKYTDKEISEKIVNTIIKAGNSAPSAKNKRPYHYIIIKDKETLKELSTVDSNSSMINQANVCIIVCGDKNIQGIIEFLIEDCSAVTQNMLLAIHSLNLGAVWCGIIMNSVMYKYLLKKFEMPDKIIPINLISIGYPNEIKKAKIIFDRNKVHYNKW